MPGTRVATAAPTGASVRHGCRGSSPRPVQDTSSSGKPCPRCGSTRRFDAAARRCCPDRFRTEGPCNVSSSPVAGGGGPHLPGDDLVGIGRIRSSPPWALLVKPGRAANLSFARSCAGRTRSICRQLRGNRRCRSALCGGCPAGAMLLAALASTRRDGIGARFPPAAHPGPGRAGELDWRFTGNSWPGWRRVPR